MTRTLRQINKAGIFLFSAVVAGLACYWVAHLFPISWRPRRDIIGFPLHYGYNIDQVYWQYALLCIFPFFSFLIYRFWERRLPPAEHSFVRARPRAMTHSFFILRQAGKVFFQGWVLAIPLLVYLGRSERVFLRLSFVIAGEVFASVALLAFLLGKNKKVSFWRVLASLNCLMTPLAIAGLGVVSNATRIMDPSGNISYVPWLPLPIIAVLSLVLLGMIAKKLINDTGVDVFKLETNLICLVTIPIVVYLVHSHLIGGVPPLDYYHDGTGLVPALGFLEGKVPWGDLIPTRGLLEDFLKFGIGQRLIDKSYWGAVNGENLLIQPLYWVGTYFFHFLLFRKNLPFLILITFCLPVQLPDLFGHYSVRLLFQPLYWLLFYRVCLDHSCAAAFGLGVSSAVLFLFNPESLFASMACFTILMARCFVRGGDRAPFRSLRFGLLGLVSGAVLLGFMLNSFGAFEGYWRYLLSFSGFRYMTAIPLILEGATVQFAIALPLVMMVIAMWWLLTKARLRFNPRDWTLAAMVLFSMLYFTKFLNRMDGHVFAVLSGTITVFYFVFEGGLGRANNLMASRISGWPLSRSGLSLVVLCLFLGVQRQQWGNRISGLSHSFQSAVPERSHWDRLGYYRQTESESKVAEDFRTLFDSYLSKTDSIFDMTNQTGLFHYLLKRTPAIPQHIVYMALNTATQRDFISSLKGSLPQLVIYYFDGNRQHWDGVPMMVRHSLLSEFLLGEYQPFVRLNGYLILKRRDLDWLPPSSKKIHFQGTSEEVDLFFTTDICHWGRALEPSTTLGAAQENAIGVSEFYETAPTRRLSVEVSTPNESAVVISPLPKEVSPLRSQIRFNAPKGNHLQFEIPVASCLQWASPSVASPRRWYVWNEGGGLIHRVTVN